MSQIVGQCPILFVVDIKTHHELIPLLALIPGVHIIFPVSLRSLHEYLRKHLQAQLEVICELSLIVCDWQAYIVSG